MQQKAKLPEISQKSRIKTSVGDKIISVITYIVYSFFAFVCMYPFYYIIINSISANNLSERGKIISVSHSTTACRPICPSPRAGMISAWAKPMLPSRSISAAKNDNQPYFLMFIPSRYFISIIRRCAGLFYSLHKNENATYQHSVAIVYSLSAMISFGITRSFLMRAAG